MKKNLTLKFTKLSLRAALAAMMMMAGGMAFAQEHQEPLPELAPYNYSGTEGTYKFAKYLWDMRDGIGCHTTETLWDLRVLLREYPTASQARKDELANLMENIIQQKNLKSIPELKVNPGIYRILGEQPDEENRLWALTPGGDKWTNPDPSLDGDKVESVRKMNQGLAKNDWNSIGCRAQGLEIGVSGGNYNGMQSYTLYARESRKHLMEKGYGNGAGAGYYWFTQFQANSTGRFTFEQFGTGYAPGRLFIRSNNDDQLANWRHSFMNVHGKGDIWGGRQRDLTWFTDAVKIRNTYYTDESNMTAFGFLVVPDRLNTIRQIISLQGAIGFFRGSEISNLKSRYKALEENSTTENIQNVIDAYDDLMHTKKRRVQKSENVLNGFYQIRSAAEYEAALFDNRNNGQNQVAVGAFPEEGNMNITGTDRLRTDIWALTRVSKGGKVYLRNHNSGYAYSIDDVGRFIQDSGSSSGVSDKSVLTNPGNDIKIDTKRSAYTLKECDLKVQGYYSFQGEGGASHLMYHAPSKVGENSKLINHKWNDDWNSAFVLIPDLKLNAEALINTRNMVGSFKDSDLKALRKAYEAYVENKNDGTEAALWTADDELTIDHADKRIQFDDSKQYIINWAIPDPFDAERQTVMRYEENGSVQMSGSVATTDGYYDKRNLWTIKKVAGKEDVYTIASVENPDRKLVIPTDDKLSAVELNGAGTEVRIVTGTSGRNADYDVVYTKDGKDYYLFFDLAKNRIVASTTPDMGLINWNFQEMNAEPMKRWVAGLDLDRVDTYASASLKPLVALIDAYDADPSEENANAFISEYKRLRADENEKIKFDPNMVYRIHSGWKDGVMKNDATGMEEETSHINKNQLFVFVEQTNAIASGPYAGKKQYILQSLDGSGYMYGMRYASNSISYSESPSNSMMVTYTDATFHDTPRDDQPDRKFIAIVGGADTQAATETDPRYFRSADSGNGSANRMVINYGYSGLNTGGNPFDKFSDFSLEPMPKAYVDATMKYLRDLDRVGTYWSEDVQVLATLVHTYELAPTEENAAAIKKEYDRLETALADRIIVFEPGGVYRIHTGWKDGYVTTGTENWMAVQPKASIDPMKVTADNKEESLKQMWTFVPAGKENAYYLKNLYTSDYLTSVAGHTLSTGKTGAQVITVVPQTFFKSNDLNNQPTRKMLKIEEGSYFNDAENGHDRLREWNVDYTSDFTLEPIKSIAVAIGKHNAVTFSHTQNLIQPGKLEAYKAYNPHTADPDCIETAKMSGEREVYRGNNGVILWSAEPDTYELICTDERQVEPMEGKGDYSGNRLVGTYNTPYVTDGNGSNRVYALNWRTVGSESSLWFNTTAPNAVIGKNKAYLPLETFTNGNAAKFFFVFGNSQTTSISITDYVKAKDDGCYYSLSGLRVTNPQKGIYIRNGKKIVIK